MRIARAELYELALPLTEPFIISGGAMRERRSWVVVLEDGEGHRGYGECPPFHRPFYSAETLSTARAILTEVLLPRVTGQSWETPEALDAALTDDVRGNPFARAAIETAAWDLDACRRGTGLAALLGNRLGVVPAARVPCGVALGIPGDRRIDLLLDQVRAAVAQGYRRVKIKIAPEWDREPLRAVQGVLHESGLPLTADANGAYRWPEDRDRLRSLDDVGLLYLEQPLAPDELLGHAELAGLLRTPVCLDETLHSARVARQVVELGGPRVWNVKIHRVGGLTEALRVHRLAAAGNGVALWAGTMPESGLGAQAALAFAALPGCVYPSDLEPSTRWFGPHRDVIELRMAPDGTMAVPAQSIAGLLDADRFRSAARLIPF